MWVSGSFAVASNKAKDREELRALVKTTAVPVFPILPTTERGREREREREKWRETEREREIKINAKSTMINDGDYTKHCSV